MPVYKFRVKNNMSYGRVNLTSGMNVEVVDEPLFSSMWNTRVQDLFVKEFAKKYQITEDIRGLFNRNYIDGEEL